MRHRWSVSLLFTLLLPAFVSAQQAQDRRPGFAVFPFDNGGSYGASKEDLDALRVGIQSMMLTELSINTNLRIVDRSHLRQILEEQGLAQQGRIDPETAARIGRIVGARYALVGSFVDLDGDFRLDGHIVDVETTELIKGERLRGPRRDLYDLIVDFAALVVRDVELPELPERVREARKARDIPAEALTLYSRAQVFEDAGRREQAIDLYRQISTRFPAMTEAQDRLRQLTGG